MASDEYPENTWKCGSGAEDGSLGVVSEQQQLKFELGRDHQGNVKNKKIKLEIAPTREHYALGEQRMGTLRKNYQNDFTKGYFRKERPVVYILERGQIR